MNFNDLPSKAGLALQSAIGLVPHSLAETLKLRAFALLKIPLIAFLNPKVVNVDDQGATVRLPLNYRSKNHLNSMYFAALAAGADLVIGLIAMRTIERSPYKISLVFKDFHAEFLKRATGDVHFICNQAEAINELVQKAATSDERVEATFDAIATVPSESNEPVAKFRLTLSLKKRV